MTSELNDKSVLARVILSNLPPMICKSLVEQRSFREEYGMRADAVLAFDDSDISFQRSKLFDAIRRVFSDNSSITVIDVLGRKWVLEVRSNIGEFPVILICNKEQSLILEDFNILSSDCSLRLRSFEKAASDSNFPDSARLVWQKILSERPLEDDEIYEFHSDIRDTPAHIAQVIFKELQKRNCKIPSLVPLSHRYFERLIGPYDGSSSISDYANSCARKSIDRLLEWRVYDGFLFSLFLSSHSSLTAEITVDHLGNDDLVHAFDFIENYGDRISQLGAIEVGLRILPARPKLEPYIARLIEQIRDDNVIDSTSQFKLLSALVVLVDGELSRTRILADYPPYYRRLAALTQAALIHRQMLSSSGIDIDSFSEWAYKSRIEQFYLQSLADMRLEPRWNPEFATASQLKADFFGRIMISARNYERNILGKPLHTLVLSTEPTSLFSLSEFPYPYFPGPLEGGENSANTLPEELSKVIDAQLMTEGVGISSFSALVNSALIFHILPRQAEFVAEALKISNYRLSNINDRSELLAIFAGLATVAAVTRTQSLADELRFLIRRYRQEPSFSLSSEEIMRICLVAAASRSKKDEWMIFVGDWLTELAFGDFKNRESLTFQSHLRCLLHSIPELWVTCGRADAATRAYNATFNNT